MQEVKVIDDTEEETVTDEPIIRGGEVEQINEPLAEETEALPEQDDEVFVSPVYRQYLEAQKINPQCRFQCRRFHWTTARVSKIGAKCL